MKKVISFALLLVMVTTIFPFSALAADTSTVADNSTEIIYLADGDYIVVTRGEYVARASGSKTGYVTYTYVNSGTTMWTATLTASFTYTGSSATCTNSALGISISDSHYYEVSRSVGHSGNTATADFTMGYRVLGVTVSTSPYTLTLSCDANGNLT